MSDSLPYLGCKISLISKSEIRYEGVLYTIDAQESIIALAKVQSFGTEDRQADLAVPAKNDIYEYIIFRGTDIKKIEICETPKQLPNLHDPAIVGVQVQQHATPAVATSYPGASFNHQPLGPIGSHGNYYGNYGQQLAQQTFPSPGFSLGATQPSELSGGIGSSVGSVGVNVDPQSPVGGSQPVPAPIGPPSHSGMASHSHQQDVLGGSRSSTPSASRKSPVIDAGVQVSPPPPQQADKKRSSNQRSMQQPPSQQHQHQQQQQHHQQQQHQQQQHQQQQHQQQQHHHQQQQQQHHQQTQNRGSRESQNNQMRRTGQGYYQQGQNSYQFYQGSRHNQGYQGHQGYYQGQQQSYQGQYRGGGMGGRGRATRRASQPRGRGVFNQGNRQRQQIYDEEFDFEQANVEFEELRTQLAKTKITENGEKKEDKKDDSGHETATTGDESEDSSSSVYYDKTKSFFDSISCEALERSKGRSQRSDWRVERKINVQTFGVATARRGYYPRGRGGYYNRGGYYRNYNQGFYRGNNSNYRGSRGGGGGGTSGTAPSTAAAGTATGSATAGSHSNSNGSSSSNRTSSMNGTAAAGAVGGPSSSATSSYASMAAK